MQSPDGTVRSLDVYVNKAAEDKLDACKPLAHQILMSVAPGTKKLQLEAGERRLSAYSKDFEISITVNKNTVVTTQVGPDFLVHRIIVLGQLGRRFGQHWRIYWKPSPLQSRGKKGSGNPLWKESRMVLGRREKQSAKRSVN